MKKLFCLLSFSFFFGYEESPGPVDATDLVGRWLLVAQYKDPGDGSGTFTPIDSKKVIKFFADGTYRSNGETCAASPNVDQSSTGTYSTVDNIIRPDNCTFRNIQQGITIHYELKDDLLELSFACKEGCGQRYKKIK